MGKNILQIPETSSSDGLDLMHIARNGEDYSIKTSLIAGIATNDSTSGNWARGGVIYSGTGLVYNVWVNSCSINGVVYNSFVSGDVTLTAGDATNPRFDIFIVKVNTLSGTPVFTLLAEEGTPASSPLLPSISIVSEAQISFRLTAANETSDSDTTTDLIYDENVGNAGGEWNNTTNTTSGNLDYATDPYNGTKSFNTPATVSDSISWTKTSLKTFTPSDSLIFPLKSLLSIKSGLQIKLINSSNNEYFLKTIRYSEMESFGFIPGVSGWQLVQINLSEFDTSITSNTQYDRIEYTFINTPTIGLDWIHIQGGLEQATPSVLPYKHMAGLIFQTGSGNPTFELGYNDLWFTPNFIRQSTGIYHWETSGLGLEDKKTFSSISQDSSLDRVGMKKDYSSNPTKIILRSYNYFAPNFTTGDGIINGNWFEFRVYN